MINAEKPTFPIDSPGNDKKIIMSFIKSSVSMCWYCFTKDLPYTLHCDSYNKTKIMKFGIINFILLPKEITNNKKKEEYDAEFVVFLHPMKYLLPVFHFGQ